MSPLHCLVALVLGQAAPSEAPVEPRVAVLTTVAMESEDDNELQRRRYLSATLGRAAREVLSYRRIAVVELDPEERCEDRSCAASLAEQHGLTELITSRLSQSAEGCSIEVQLRDESGRPVKQLTSLVERCLAEELVISADRLGREIAGGPVVATSEGLSLTPRAVPEVGVEPLPNLPSLDTSTITLDRSWAHQSEALDTYRDQHLMGFHDHGQFYVARGGEILSDCDVLRIASYRVPSRLDEFCDGNWWELAWLGVPVGGALMIHGSGALDGAGQARSGLQDVTLLTGLGTAVWGGLLAIMLNRDGTDPERGAHALTESQLRSVIAESNAELRRSLLLSESEVVVAGMAP